MSVRTQGTASEYAKPESTDRLYELLPTMHEDIKQIKKRLEQIDKPINSGKDE